MSVRTCIAICAILFVGCAQTKRPTVAARLAATRDVPHADVPTPANRDVIDASGAPGDVVWRLEKAVRRRFDLPVGPPDGQLATTASNNGGPYLSRDYFSASFRASTIHGETIDVVGEWIAEGSTRLTVTSDLPQAQYAVVLAELRRELSHPTTDPAQ